MRVLVVGAGGQLGQALVAAFGADHDVVPAFHGRHRCGQLVLDLADPGSIATALRAARPEVVVVAGADTNVDGCEQAPAACMRVNVDGPAAIAEHLALSGGAIVYYSTDYVFDGARGEYREDDLPTPLNAYGRSKAEGEAAIRVRLPERHLVLRTSWVYGPDARRMNFPLRLADNLSRPGGPARIPSDQWGSPTYTDDLAAATLALMTAGRWGTFHATGPEEIDRASLALRICDVFGLDRARVVPTPTSELAQRARRPLRVALLGHRLATTGLAKFRPIDTGLHSLRAAEASLSRSPKGDEPRDEPERAKSSQDDPAAGRHPAP